MKKMGKVGHHVWEARKALAAAESNLSTRACRAVIHEAYYAAWHAATAALATRELEYESEEAVVADFERLFVYEEATFAEETAQLLQRLAEYQLRYDYEPLPDLQDAAEYALEAARAFLDEVLPYVEGKLEEEGSKAR
jgi:uncharacterized protein (UPF0332 family)